MDVYLNNNTSHFKREAEFKIQNSYLFLDISVMIKQEQKPKYLRNRKYTNELPSFILCSPDSVEATHQVRQQGECKRKGTEKWVKNMRFLILMLV